MIRRSILTKVFSLTIILFGLFALSCKHKKKIQKTQPDTVISDTLTGRCRLDFKNSKTLSRNVKENEFNFIWVTAKANVETLIDGKEESFDIRVNIRKDSAMLVTIQYLLGIQVAKILITKL